MFRFRKRFGIGGVLLGCGLQLSAPVCLAQTAPAPDAATSLAPMTNAPMSAREKGMELQRILCAQPIDLKVSGATLSQVVKQVRAAMPDASIELRLTPEDKALQRQVDENKVKLEETKLPQFRFELEQKPLGNLLQSAANLAGYEFFVLPDQLLIAQPQQLALQEREYAAMGIMVRVSPKAIPVTVAPARITRLTLTQAEFAQGSAAMREATKLVARQLLQKQREQGESKKPTVIRFGDLAPELQQKLQTAVDFNSRTANDPSITVPANALITLDNMDKGYVKFNLLIAATNPSTEMNRQYNWRADVSSGAEGEYPDGTTRLYLPSQQFLSETP